MPANLARRGLCSIGPMICMVNGHRKNKSSHAYHQTNKRCNIAAMDWKKLIESLTAAGWKQQQIADRCGCVQSAISELATGKVKNPRFTIGQALIAMGKRKATTDKHVSV